MKEREPPPSSPQTSTTGFVSTPLRKAAKHVNDLWFPVNENLLAQIQGSLQEGMLDGDVSTLVEEISSDYSLFFYCVRELVQMIREEEPELDLPQNLSPSRLLEWGGVERLKKILKVEIDEISPHSLKTISPIQATRFQEAMISASTTESMAMKYAVDPDLAYSAGLLRQLGVTLIAWNYPLVYQKAVARLIDGTPLDVTLTQLFGFSPSLLAMNVVRSWNLPKSLYQSMIDSADDIKEEGWSEDYEVDAISKVLVKLCRTGEALARANNPSTYPSAGNDWEFARIEIEQVLGAQGMNLVREKMRDNCLRYTEMVPQLFTPAFVLDPEAHISECRLQEMLDRNPYVDRCRPFLKKKLTIFYRGIRPFEVSRENLNLLAKDIIPSAGFNEGCVFTLDPVGQILVPQLAIGKSTLKEFTAQACAASADSEPSLLALALESEKPLIIRSPAQVEPIRVKFACPLGVSQRLGVLLLELRAAMYDSDTEHHLIHFQAICQAFNDCLNLK